MDLQPLAVEFLTHLRVERRLSCQTVYAYDHDIRTFLRFLAHHEYPATVESVSAESLRRYLVCLEARRLRVLSALGTPLEPLRPVA